MNAEDLVFAAIAADTTVGDCAIIRDRPFFTTHALVTRGTTCWAARLVDGEMKDALQHMAVGIENCLALPGSQA